MAGRQAQKHLLDKWRVRFLLVPEGRFAWTLESHLGLKQVARSRGVALYQVPEEGQP